MPKVKKQPSRLGPKTLLCGPGEDPPVGEGYVLVGVSNRKFMAKSVVNRVIGKEIRPNDTFYQIEWMSHLQPDSGPHYKWEGRTKLLAHSPATAKLIADFEGDLTKNTENVAREVEQKKIDRAGRRRSVKK